MSRRWCVFLLLPILGCAARGATVHIDRAERALARNEPFTAERHYERALTDGEDDPWVRAMVEKGRARAEILKRRIQLRVEPPRGEPTEELARLRAQRDEVQGLGGDPATDAELVAALEAIGARVVDDAGQLPPEQLVLASRRVQPVSEMADLSAPLRARADAIISAARQRLLESAARARGRFPLTERAYLGLAAMHHGSPVDVDPRVDAYARGVELAVTGRPCAQLQHLLSQALPARGTSRRATVTIELSHCEDESRWTTSEEMAEWRERVAPFVKRRTVKVTECSRSATPVYACSGTPMTCSHAGTALGRTNCTTFDRVVEDPVYNFERRRDLRPFRVLSGRYYVAGRWRVTRDGREWTDTFQFETPLSGRTSEAWKDSPPIREVPAGDFQTPAAAPIVAAVRAVLDESFADDIARAVEAARAREAAGQVDEADEAWIQVALLGGEPGGRFAQLGVTAADLRAAFLAVNPERWQLASARTFHLPRRPPKYTERNLMNLQAALVPIGKHVWFEGGGGNIALPAIQPMGEPAPLGGLSAMTLDLRFGGSFVGQKRKSAYGLRLHDDASVAFGAGMVYDKPEDAVGSSGFHASAGYALGVGYRHPAIGGLAIGARPELGYVKVGLNGGAHTSVPAFGRLELAIGLRSLTLEAYAPLVGDARTGGAVHLAWVRKQREGEKLRLTRFISVRYDRRELDVTLDVPTDIERDVTVEDHEISTASASFGLGF